jgi:uncharacterized protein (DUF58 family)
VSLGFWLPTLVIAFLAGAFFSLPWLSIFSAAAGIIIGVAYAWREYALHGVTYVRRWRYTRGFPGEETQLELDVQNNKRLPLSWLRVTDPWPTAILPSDKDALTGSTLQEQANLINLFSLSGNSRVRRTYQMRFQKRGVYPIGPSTLESGDFFGLYVKEKQQNDRGVLTIFPELLPMASLNLPADDPFGDRGARKRLFEDPNLPVGVRPYQAEDEIRRVHWPATARTGELQVKVYQPVTSRVLTICLNVLTTSQPWLGTHAELLEQLIRVAASIAYHGYQDGYSVGLISNGCLARADHPFQIAPGRSPQHLASLLEALAAVTAYTTAPFESFLTRSMPGVPYGATMVIVTALLPPVLIETLLQVKRYRPNTTLVSLSTDAPPQIPGIRNIHLPYQT